LQAYRFLKSPSSPGSSFPLSLISLTSVDAALISFSSRTGSFLSNPPLSSVRVTGQPGSSSVLFYSRREFFDGAGADFFAPLGLCPPCVPLGRVAVLLQSANLTGRTPCPHSFSCIATRRPFSRASSREEPSPATT